MEKFGVVFVHEIDDGTVEVLDVVIELGVMEKFKITNNLFDQWEQPSTKKLLLQLNTRMLHKTLINHMVYIAGQPLHHLPVAFLYQLLLLLTILFK